MVVRLSDALQARERGLEILAPVKEFYEAVTNSDDWMEMSAVIKVLGYKGWGRNNVFKLLRERNVLRYNNEPYQQYVERGCFKTIEQVFETACGESMINRKTMVSQRGLDFIRKLIAEEITA
jgi:phage antirepressor YoqD-like protein